jgi:hypothetical protein
LEFVHKAQTPLRVGLPLVRMSLRKSGQRSQILIDFWVVLHGTRAERIEPEINGIVPLGETGIMSDYIHFTDLRQTSNLLPNILAREHVFWSFLGRITLGKGEGCSFRASLLKNKWFIENQTLGAHGFL